MLTLVHEINLAISWLGRPIKVTAICSPHEELGISEVDVISDIMTLHESGAVSQIHMDFVQKRFHRTGVISCENGWISYDYASNQILFYEKNTTDSQVLWSASNYDINDSYLAMIKTFIRYTKEGRIKHAYDASCGALDVEHVCAALQSDKIKQWVEVGSSTLNVARG